MSVVCPDVRREAFAEASRFRAEFYECLAARRDEMFELADALLCVDGPVTSPVDLTMVPEHRRGHGALYGALNRGRIDVERLRTLLAGLPLPRFEGGRLVLAVDVSPWLRSDAPCSADRLFCHVYGRAQSASQFIPGWPYSFVAVLEPGATSWTSILDVVRLGPEDDATAVTANQLRAVAERFISAGQWAPGDPAITIVMDAGYDVTRLAWVLRPLPVELVGRIRSDRVMRLRAPPRRPDLRHHAVGRGHGADDRVQEASPGDACLVTETVGPGLGTGTQLVLYLPRSPGLADGLPHVRRRASHRGHRDEAAQEAAHHHHRHRRAGPGVRRRRPPAGGDARAAARA
jgi:hypothetical protein